MTDTWPSSPPTAPPAPPSTPPEWRGFAAPSSPPTGGTTTGFGQGGGMGVPPPPRSGRGPIVAGAVTLVLVLVIGTLLWLFSRPADDVEAASSSPSTSTTTSTTAPSTTTPQGPSTSTAPPTTTPGPTTPPPSQAELDAVVAELSRFVEQERGLTFKEPVSVRLAVGTEFDDLLREASEVDPAEIEAEGLLLQTLGLIPPGTDYQAVVDKLLSAGVLGYYDPTTKELVVRGGALTPYVRETLVHELVHALDDQHFGLDRPEYDERKDEIGFGLTAVAEGNARRIQQAWVDQLSPAEAAERDREELEFGSNIDLTGVPLSLLSFLDAPYTEGELLVDDILAGGGQAELDAAFVDPPDTSEQVLHPDRFRLREPRVDVPPPLADGEILDDGVLGELTLRITLEQVVGLLDADEAADGWGGDWYVLWQDDERGSCLRADIVTDRPADLDELTTALESWASTLPDATVEPSGSDGVEITSCVTASGGGVSPL